MPFEVHILLVDSEGSRVQATKGGRVTCRIDTLLFTASVAWSLRGLFI